MTHEMTPAQEGQTLAVLQAVMTERRHQHAKWGVQRHDWPVWLTVLSEEVGELAQEILALRAWRFQRERVAFNGPKQIQVTNAGERSHLRHMRAEAVQVAAVAVAMIEHLDERIGDAE